MAFSDFLFKRLNINDRLKPFDCGDKDLNDYFLADALNYYKQLLTVTYSIESEKETIAFFSLLNDKISIRESKKSIWNSINRNVKNSKKRESYPAMKIARLGVSSKYQKDGLGRDILDYLKNLFVFNNRTGCRFITVDAYQTSMGFYERNGFKYLTEDDPEADTRLMYFDLMTIK